MQWDALLFLNVPLSPSRPYRAALEDLGVVPSEEIRALPHGTKVAGRGA